MKPDLRIYLFLFLLQAVLPNTVTGTEKPNFIVIYTDDHGWPDIGAAGIYDDLKTPHLDEMASSGLRATAGYSTAPQCVPSRAGLLTGRSQNRFGLESNPSPLDGFNSELTIAERLKKIGYATGQIGKWHLGPTPDITDHGFDDVYSKNANRPCYANFTLEGETIPMQQVNDGLYHLDACSRAAVTFIDRHQGTPFFLYLAYRAPHVPLDAPQSYLSRFPGEMPERRRQALAMIAAMDDGLGSIRAALKEKGLLEKTLIFFIGDNGAPLKIHRIDAPGGGPGWDGSLNEPMNGEKGMLAEGGIRVPFLASWPGTIPAGQTYDHPITAMDATATALSQAGLALDETIDGVDLIPFFSGEESGPPHRFIAWRWIAQSAVRQGPWKLLRGGTREYLFNLEQDPGERNNLIDRHPEIAGELRTRLDRWAAQLNPPGLGEEPMSPTWETYFDHYLDGKPAPLPTGQRNQPENSIRGWIARNASLTSGPGGLVVKAENRKRSPFLVVHEKRSGPFQIKVTLRSERNGQIGASWRTASQEDFVDAQVVRVPLDKPDGIQTIRLEIPEESPSIHFRILLPPGDSEVSHIAFENGGPPKNWNFKEPRGD